MKYIFYISLITLNLTASFTSFAATEPEISASHSSSFYDDAAHVEPASDNIDPHHAEIHAPTEAPQSSYSAAMRSEQLTPEQARFLENECKQSDVSGNAYTSFGGVAACWCGASSEMSKVATAIKRLGLSLAQAPLKTFKDILMQLGPGIWSEFKSTAYNYYVTEMSPSGLSNQEVAALRCESHVKLLNLLIAGKGALEGAKAAVSAAKGVETSFLKASSAASEEAATGLLSASTKYQMIPALQDKLIRALGPDLAKSRILNLAKLSGIRIIRYTTGNMSYADWNIQKLNRLYDLMEAEAKKVQITGTATASKSGANGVPVSGGVNKGSDGLPDSEVIRYGDGRLRILPSR